jgi:hypothetical protein
VTAVTAPTVREALPELLALALASRDDLDPADLADAVRECLAAPGWTWERTMVEVARMCAQGLTPDDLREACADPTHPQVRGRRHKPPAPTPTSPALTAADYDRRYP